ncbi:MAG: L,D-transpeptidase family protein [Ginsengibacter sp.]
MKRICLLFLTAISFSFVGAQSNFYDVKKLQAKVSDVYTRLEDTLCKQFTAKGLKWPAKYIYIRSFKYEASLEIWAKNEYKEPYKLFKTYKVCMQSGTMGPKRLQGDFQVPEGFYYINEYNANSIYHFALGLNYPNFSDRLLSDSLQPGSDIYIHGNCVSVGCIPVNDKQIEELYVITTSAKNNGEDFIPVHIYPVKYALKKSTDYLTQAIRLKPSLAAFNIKLKAAYDHFEKTKQLPVIMTNKKGEYVVN